VTQHLVSCDFVAAQGKAKATMGPRQSPSTLDKLVPKSRGLFEYPKRRSFRSRWPIHPSRSHLEFTIEVVREYRRQEVQLIG